MAVAEVLDDVERDFTACLPRCSDQFDHTRPEDLSIYALEDYCEIKHVMVSFG